ncbi:hypothetical protein RS9917_04620 [Synechococcus sp. RS9917]|nr:hypothetical protein RS9917_04620 [Synechococcus sp. RS9917]
MLSLIILFYPSLFIFSLDIYRDVLMVFLCLIIFAIVSYLLQSPFSLIKIFFLFNFLLLSFILFKLRPYLGLASIIPLFIKYRLFGHRLFYFFGFLVIFLLAFFISGFLDPILNYRGSEGFIVGGSSFGITLLNLNPFSFFGSFILSYIYQVFGLYFSSISSVFVFAVETLPFLFAFSFVVRKRHLLDSYSLYLVYFFVIYTVIFVLGNDNLGTAIRLRIPSYLAVYIVSLRLYALDTYFNQLRLQSHS